MDSYDMIDSIRLRDRTGPKPNANPHIQIYCTDMDCRGIGFRFGARRNK